MKYLPGKVYLRNRNNGIVYEYESNLAANSNIETFTPTAAEIKEAAKATPEAVTPEVVEAEPVAKAPPAPVKPAAKK